MKNEYLFRKFILTSRKKNYLGEIHLKEGGVYKRPKLDIKGLSFGKSNFNQELCDHVEELVDGYMRDELEPAEILERLKEVDETVLREMKSEETAMKYFKVSKINDPMDELQKSDHRGTAVKFWNYLELGDEISVPGAFRTTYIDITMTKMLKKEYPDMFVKISNFIIDYMIWYNKQKVVEKIDDIAKSFPEKDLDDIRISDKDRGGIFFSAHIKDSDDVSVLLAVAESYTLDDDEKDYLIKKVRNKMVQFYNIKSGHDMYDEVKEGIQFYDDGEHLCLKVYNIMVDDINMFEYNVLEVWVDAFRLVLGTLMNNKGLDMYEKLNEDIDGRKLSTFKLRKMKATKKRYRDMTKIALPYNMSSIPQFILDVIDPTKVVTQTPNLFGPVADSIGLYTPRIGNGRMAVTNVLEYY